MFPKTARNNSARGEREQSVPAFYDGQNCAGIPDHYESLQNAREMLSDRRAKSINRRKAILIFGPRPQRVDTRDSLKSRWVVTNQTPRPFTKKHLIIQPHRIGPGAPSYALV